MRRCGLLPSGKWGEESKAFEQSALGRDMRLIKNASNNVDGKNRAIMETNRSKCKKLIIIVWSADLYFCAADGNNY